MSARGTPLNTSSAMAIDPNLISSSSTNGRTMVSRLVDKNSDWRRSRRMPVRGFDSLDES